MVSRYHEAAELE